MLILDRPGPRFSARAVVLALWALTLSACKDTYSSPIVDPAMSQHRGTPLLGAWRVVALLGEVPEAEIGLTLASSEGGELELRFDSDPGSYRRCAVLRDGSDFLLSMQGDSRGATESRWKLLLLKVPSSGDKIEVFVTKFASVKAAVLESRLQGRVTAFVEGEDFVMVESDSTGLKEFFENNSEVFSDVPAVVLARVR